jgi:DNA-binding transcriptional LysR family regulator
MDMRRLEAFCRVVEFRSFTRAAEAMGLSQPTVSEHVRVLEDILQERMVDRLGRRVLPTPAGRVFYEYARRILRLREDAIEALAQFKETLIGHLMIGASTIPGTYVLPDLIGRFKAAHTGIRITLAIGDSASIMKQTADDLVEAGFVGAEPGESNLMGEEIFADELVLVVYAGHPFENRSHIEAAELLDQPFILREQGSGTRNVARGLLASHGIDLLKLSVVAEMGSTEAVRQGIKARIGISILSHHAVREDVHGGILRAVRIRDLSMQRPLFLVKRRNRMTSPVCDAFLQYVRETTAGTA